MSHQTPRPDEATPVVMARPVEYARRLSPPNDLEMSYVRRRDALVAALLVLLVSIIAPFVLLLGLSMLAPPLDGEESDGVDGAVAMIVQKWCEMGLAAGLVLCLLLGYGIKPASFGLRRNRIGRQVLWGMGTLAGVYTVLVATSALVGVLVFLFPSLEDDLMRRVDFVEELPVDNLARTLLLLVPVAIHEELVFRGLLVPCLRRVLGSWWWAGLVSASLFAGLHIFHQGVLAGMIQIFGVGVVLTVFFIVSRSLLAVTIAHFLFDFVQFQVIRMLPDLEQMLEEARP